MSFRGVKFSNDMAELFFPLADTMEAADYFAVSGTAFLVLLMILLLLGVRRLLGYSRSGEIDREKD
jgi:hypothetical protein